MRPKKKGSVARAEWRKHGGLMLVGYEMFVRLLQPAKPTAAEKRAGKVEASGRPADADAKDKAAGANEKGRDDAGAKDKAADADEKGRDDAGADADAKGKAADADAKGKAANADAKERRRREFAERLQSPGADLVVCDEGTHGG